MIKDEVNAMPPMAPLQRASTSAMQWLPDALQE
jgi:hypothetical protein